MQGSSLTPNLNRGTIVEQQKTAVIVSCSQDHMLKIGILALFSTSHLGVAMLAMVSPKDGVFCIGLYWGNAWVCFLLLIFIWLNVLAVQRY